MKKLIMAAVAATLVAAPALADKLTYKSSAAEFRAAYESVASVTNADELKKSLADKGFWEITYSHDPDVVAFRLEADAALADRGVKALWDFPVTWPKVSAAQRSINGVETNLVVRFALARKLGCDAAPSTLAKCGATVGDMAACLEEAVKFSGNPMYIGQHAVNELKRAIQNLAVKGVKKALRRQGRSFVTKDGVSPCGQYMTALNAALNAPRFEGLGAWLKELGFADGFDTSPLPSAEEVAALKEKILDGDIDLAEGLKTQLYVCLGVDGYNAFVKEYNGDK